MSERKRLVVVCGLPGTGKTTVAGEFATRFDADLIRTDVVRKDCFPDPEYTAAETRSTYDETLERAAQVLERDGVVVVDGTFRRKSLRGQARGIARDEDAAFELIRVECAESVVRRRIDAREGDESDADFDIHKLLQSEFEPPTVAHHTIDNSGTLSEMREQVAGICKLLEARVP